MKSAWGWANGGQPVLVCHIRKYVIILGGYSRWRPPNQNIGDVSPASPAGLTLVNRTYPRLIAAIQKLSRSDRGREVGLTVTKYDRDCSVVTSRTVFQLDRFWDCVKMCENAHLVADGTICCRRQRFWPPDIALSWQLTIGKLISGIELTCFSSLCDTIKYDTRCYFNVRSKADISQLNLPHGTAN